MQATLRGVKEVGIAIIAGTLTTIIVFVPIMFGAQTDISVFMTHVGVTIIVALLASLFIAQTLVPMLAARIDVAKDHSVRGFDRGSNSTSTVQIFEQFYSQC
jgi:HAE1 family hydrophobic/amphiphilic exporter-1|tara:strand:- start:558 stop:863 length:306 start_codon:yes stop_codon:yes gene_type:complete